MILATHFILIGYGHWLPNDVRGSYSQTVFAPRIAELGPLHHGRKPVQPSGPELRTFHKHAETALRYPVHWFSPEERTAIRDALAPLHKAQRLVCHACAILLNHVHILIRRNFLHPKTIHDLLKDTAAQAVRQMGRLSANHPVFNAGHGIHYKSAPWEVRQCATYIRDNFKKHRLPEERYEFVSDYTG